MKKKLYRSLFHLLLLGYLNVATVLTAEAHNLKLFGRSSGASYSIDLNKSDWRWLSDKGKLRLGITATDYAPFNILVSKQYYEGLTADYAKLIADIVHADIEIQRFASQSEALDALKREEIDFLGSISGFENLEPELVMSTAYSELKPVLATRSNEANGLSFDLNGKTMALCTTYLPEAMVKTFYPNIKVTVYPTAVAALEAVAFGQADVYLGDAISTNFLTSRNYLNDLQLSDFSRLDARGLGFALKHDNPRLLRIINTALAAIPTSEHVTIIRRWSGGALLPQNEQLSFNLNEQRWMLQHSRLRVGALNLLPPLSFFDENGKFSGIGADILDKISRSTGLKFDVVRASNKQELFELLKRGEADLVLSANDPYARSRDVLISRPYLIAPLVLVTPEHSKNIDDLEDLTGKKLAQVPNSLAADYIKNHYPTVNITYVDSISSAAQAVAMSKVQGTLMNLMSARHLINTQYRDQLRIVAGATGSMADLLYSFAVDRDALELHSILDKALINISPEEIDEVISYWRNKAATSETTWIQYKPIIVRSLVIGGLMLLAAIIWITYLRKLVSKREQAERALSDQISLMRALFDGTPHPIYIRDRAGSMLICNTHYLKAMNVELEQVIGKTIVDAAFADQLQTQAMHEEYLQVMAEDSPRIQDKTVYTTDGRTLTIYQWLQPFKDSDGIVIGLVAGWIDVSERQHLLEQLQSAKKSSDDASRAKSAFLATMSHEIRTPMNAVIGMLELALKKANQGIVDRFAIEVAYGAAREQLDLIGDILDIARIESGRLSLAPERANVRELVEAVVRVFEGAARQKNLQLFLDFDLSCKSDVLIDPQRFKQILSNLLSNAIKFTQIGEVRLTVRALPGFDNERLALWLSVTDSGIGISEEDQAQLFSPFTQASNHNQPVRGGSGLGLVISRTLCEMMHGQLRLSSQLGKGTRIEIALDLLTLPDLPAIEVVKPKLQPQARPLKILVIDDYPANRLLLSQQLSYLGHQVSDAEDGAHGLRDWRNGHFDVIITDCNMPLMSGYDLARAVRDEEHNLNLSPCLILGFTANAQAEEKQRCVDAGMDECLFKPISLKDLSVHLNQVKTGPAPRLEPPQVMASSENIDLTSLEQLTRGDQNTIRNLLGDLASSNEEDMHRLTRFFFNHDLPGLSDLAHRVKGGARIIRAQHLIQCCEQVEDACSGLDSVRLLHSVEALQLAMEQMASQLEQHIGPPSEF
ncbi:transporter substrate-binding domain-containing protein [Pseudomonas chlororaphis subsp. piscium]